MKQRIWKNTTVSQAEITRLVGRSEGCIQGWIIAGLPRQKNGRFHLLTALQWIERHYREKATIRISLDALDQFQLSDLLGVSRQTISKWRRLGLPHDNGRYDLRCVVRWLLQSRGKKE